MPLPAEPSRSPVYSVFAYVCFTLSTVFITLQFWLSRVLLETCNLFTFWEERGSPTNKSPLLLCFLLFWGFSFFLLDWIGLARERRTQGAWAEGEECLAEIFYPVSLVVVWMEGPCHQGTVHLKGHGALPFCLFPTQLLS